MQQSDDLSNRVAILDAGAQYGKVIDRRVRALHVRSDMLPLDTPFSKVAKYGAVILSGGPDSVYADGSIHPDPALWNSGLPILGICYGMQLINQAFGGRVGNAGQREDGQCEVSVDRASALFHGLKKGQHVLMSHGDSITAPAEGFAVTAHSGEIVAAIADEKRNMFGVQFHPEVDLTDHGTEMFTNFLFNIAALNTDFTLKDKVLTAIEHIKTLVKDRKVLSFVSGGVDSTVCTALLARAIPAEHIYAVHIDTGFMREGESDDVKRALKKAGINLTIVRAAERFLNASTMRNEKPVGPLHAITDPEDKRLLIGDAFMQVLDEVCGDLGLQPDDTVLAQGTLRPDLIESASAMASDRANVIKTHHNDTALVRKLRISGRVVEPLSELHKDEVREIGESIGLPRPLVWRQPFPGPGLAVRLLCADAPHMPVGYEGARATVAGYSTDEIRADLLPIRTVGVQGDGRSYGYAVALSGLADWAKLTALAAEIPKRVSGVNRVVYVFGPRLHDAPDGITPTHLSTDTLEQLRQADAIVMRVLRRDKLTRKLSQVPVISFPVHFGQPGARSIAIRTFITHDYMTGVPARPGTDIPARSLEDMVAGIASVPGVARVTYDLTAKPPGTIEWE